MGRTGYRFFVEDEDEYGLEDLLQALCFAEQGTTYAPAKPWEPQSISKWINSAALLSGGVRSIMKNLPKSQE